ncbi:MAG: hypothetical protein KUG69_09710 [Marinosulfonomonas sp.]|nr:hypothetical protein [Marinosulfonomonas sp.]
MCYTDTMLRILPLMIALCSPAYGDGFKHVEKSANAPPLPKIEYYCTDATGARRELGEVICINASCLTWMAKCGMSLNNAVWRKLQDGCPTADLRTRIRALMPTNTATEKTNG